jgi:hypothetical protein
MRQELVKGVKACPGIRFQAFTRDANDFKEYKSLSRCVDKGTEIRFQIFIEAHSLDGLRLPLRCDWVRRNYGQEASNNQMSADEHGSFDVLPNQSNGGRDPRKYNWTRNAEYRGVHTMEVKILDSQGKLLFGDIIGVHIR